MNTRSITAKELLALLTSRSGLASGEVYEVSEPISPESGTTLRGNGATVICENGFDFRGVSDVRLDNLKIESGEFAVRVDRDSKYIGFKDCKISADNAIVSSGSDVTLQGCEISAKECGIISSGRYFIAKNNKITAAQVGIEMTEGSYNSMAAQNTVKAGKSITVKNGFNCVVVMNDAENIVCEVNSHIYVIRNIVGGNIELKGNDYLICDSNTVGGGVLNTDNKNFNGDNLHDVNARLDCGADERLLPHIDREQFVGMERREYITDLSYESDLNFNEYIINESGKGSVVIVPPGAYTAKSTINITEEQSDIDFYFYGAYIEATFTHSQIWRAKGVKNVTVNGMTVGHTRSTCGQVHIVTVDKENNKLTVIPSAGFIDGFHKVNPTMPNDTIKEENQGYQIGLQSVYHRGEWRPYGGYGVLKDTEDNGDGTYTITMSQVDFMEVGDIYVMRIKNRGYDTVRTDNANSVLYRDLTAYPVSNSATCRATYSYGVRFERYISSVPTGYEITKEVYDKYKAYEEKYGVDFGVYYDENKKMYRGPEPLWGGTGGMEIMDSYEGTTVISSKVEWLCDDGSNQRGTSSRVAGMVKNDDGTYTVYYKGNLCSVRALSASRVPEDGVKRLGMCAKLEIGDVIVAYTSDGRVLINDAPVLTSPKAGSPEGVHLAHSPDKDGRCVICGKPIRTDDSLYKDLDAEYDNVTGFLKFRTTRHPVYEAMGPLTWSTEIYSVKIDAKYVNESLLEKYDFCLNTENPTKRVILDNVSKNCSKLKFDNVLMENIKSRGILAKTKYATVINCTFRNLTLQALVLGPEQEWSESTISRNVLVERCIFDNCAATHEFGKKNHVGYDAEPNITPIDIRGVGDVREAVVSNVEPHPEMLASDFIIRQNKFINTPNKHLISVTGARDVMITDNVFEERDGDGEIIYINGCYNVNVANNEYTDRMKAFFDEGNQEMIAEIYNCEKVKVENLNIPEKVTLKPNRKK